MHNSTRDSRPDSIPIYNININEINIDDINVRKHDQDRDLSELARSIERHGQLQPIVLLGNFRTPPYQLIIGQRRFLAVKNILKHVKIKAIFAGNIDNTEATIRSLVENMVRVDLPYEDTADAITKLYKDFHRDDRKVSKETGISLKKVRQFIYIEERASAETKKKLRKRQVTPIDVQRALRAASEDISKADQLLDLMGKYRLDTYQKVRMVDYGQVHPRASADEIIACAKKPVIERTFVVKLSEIMRKALLEASNKMAMAPDELAAYAVGQWLMEKGFVEHG